MINTLNTIVLTAAGTAAGNEVPNAIHLIKQVIETRAHL